MPFTVIFEFNYYMMLEIIKKSWGWTGAVAVEIIAENDFGNVIFKAEKGDFWRICPEELSCQMIAENLSELENLFKEAEFIKDWEMVDVCNLQFYGLAAGYKVITARCTRIHHNRSSKSMCGCRVAPDQMDYHFWKCAISYHSAYGLGDSASLHQNDPEPGP